MKLSGQNGPITYLKVHAAEIVRTLRDRGEPLIITQNGKAKVVIDRHAPAGGGPGGGGT